MSRIIFEVFQAGLSRPRVAMEFTIFGAVYSQDGAKRVSWSPCGVWNKYAINILLSITWNRKLNRFNPPIRRRYLRRRPWARFGLGKAASGLSVDRMRCSKTRADHRKNAFGSPFAHVYGFRPFSIAVRFHPNRRGDLFDWTPNLHYGICVGWMLYEWMASIPRKKYGSVHSERIRNLSLQDIFRFGDRVRASASPTNLNTNFWNTQFWFATSVELRKQRDHKQPATVLLW